MEPPSRSWNERSLDPALVTFLTTLGVWLILPDSSGWFVMILIPEIKRWSFNLSRSGNPERGANCSGRISGLPGFFKYWRHKSNKAPGLYLYCLQVISTSSSVATLNVHCSCADIHVDQHGVPCGTDGSIVFGILNEHCHWLRN
jgi:hypothetical protein